MMKWEIFWNKEFRKIASAGIEYSGFINILESYKSIIADIFSF